MSSNILDELNNSEPIEVAATNVGVRNLSGSNRGTLGMVEFGSRRIFVDSTFPDSRVREPSMTSALDPTPKKTPEPSIEKTTETSSPKIAKENVKNADKALEVVEDGQIVQLTQNIAEA